MKSTASRVLVSAFVSIALIVGCAPLPAFATGSQSYVPAQNAVAPQGTKLTEKQTALGLFKYIRDNSAKGSAAYVDAQCAIDILTGTVTAGVAYPQYQAPSQSANGMATDGTSNAKAFKKVDLADPNDAASLGNLDVSLDFIDEYNAYRAKENKSEGTSLSTNVGTNCRMMAISIVQCDWSKATIAHSGAFDVGENLAWGYTSDSPFDGWYTEEKANYKEGNGGQTGHYLNIVDANGGTTATGFAIASNGAAYGVCHEQSFYTFGDFSPANITYSTAQFRSKWFDGYYRQNGGDEKLDNPMMLKVKKKTVKVKAKALKKKAKKVSNIKIKKAKGKVTCKNVSKNKKAKRFKVTSKGKVKVTKGLKKGKYKVIVKVKAAGNEDYLPASKKVKFTVCVR